MDVAAKDDSDTVDASCGSKRRCADAFWLDKMLEGTVVDSESLRTVLTLVDSLIAAGSMI